MKVASRLKCVVVKRNGEDRSGSYCECMVCHQACELTDDIFLVLEGEGYLPICQQCMSEAIDKTPEAVERIPKWKLPTA